MKRALVRRVAGELEPQTVGLGFALVAIVVALWAFGVGPTVIGVGLLALLVAD